MNIAIELANNFEAHHRESMSMDTHRHTRILRLDLV